MLVIRIETSCIEQLAVGYNVDYKLSRIKPM